MEFETYKADFTLEARNIGYSEHNIQKCLIYAERLITNGVPVIYNTTHLSALVGYKKEYIKGAVQFTNSYYRNFTIRKKNGGTRTISEPLPSLKDIQLWILNNILYKAQISDYAKAYVKKRTIKQALIFHKDQNLILRLDLQNFFGNIQFSSVEQIFRSFGYSQLIANLLAKLCLKENVLPQGASTSPCLSNIHFKNCDELIGSFCVSKGIRYTRYSDDLTFSGDFEPKLIISYVESVIHDLNLRINNDKTCVMHRGMRQAVLGAVVNEKIQTPFPSRNKIRQQMYYIKKFGFINHKNRLEIKQNNYLGHLLGKINYQIYLNKDDSEFIEYKEFLEALKNDGFLEV